MLLLACAGGPAQLEVRLGLVEAIYLRVCEAEIVVNALRPAIKLQRASSS